MDDRRCVKMVLETAQMLATTMSCFGSTSAPYKPTHRNHPCTVWTRTSSSNYARMLTYFEYICLEYSHRFGRTHKCESYYHDFVQFQWDLTADDWDKPYGTPVPNCTPFKNVIDPILAYRLYMLQKWIPEAITGKARWTKRGAPFWYTALPYAAEYLQTITDPLEVTDQEAHDVLNEIDFWNK